MTHGELEAQVATLMRGNRRTTDGHQYTLPSPESYPYQWFWDSCFHAIILSHFDAPAAQAELVALIHHQWDDGFIPHIAYWESHETILRVEWGVDGTSTLLQPPVLAYATWRVFMATGDHSFLATMYPHLLHYHQYLLSRRRSDRSLVGIVNPDESGEDNSPRFDHALGLPPQHHVGTNQHHRFQLFRTHHTCHFEAADCTGDHFWVEDVPFNVFFLESMCALGAIARELGHPTITRQLVTEQHTLARAMRTHLFHRGVFRSVSGTPATPITVDTWSHFAPLLAGLYTAAEAAALIDTYWYDPSHFATPYRLATVSASDPAFNPAEPTWGAAWQHPDWRGAIWHLPNWVVYRGLLRYGYAREAAEIRDSTFELIRRSGFRENYHPHTGAGQGAHNFTWGGLALDMFLPKQKLIV